MSDNENVEVEEQQQEPRKKGCCLKCCLSCGCLTLIVFVLPILIFGLLLSPSQKYTPEVMTINDTMMQTITVSELLNEITNAQDATEEAEIILSQEQLSSLCRIGMNSMLIVENEKNTPLATELPWQVQYIDGKISGEYSIPDTEIVIFGKTITAQATVLPYLDDNQTGIYIYSLKIGNRAIFNYSKGLFIDIKDIRFEDNSEYLKYRPGVKSIAIQPDNSIKIVYYPYYFRPFISDLEAILYGN